MLDERCCFTADFHSRDLHVSKRASIDDKEWGEPQPLWMLNTTDWDSCPALSLDEHRLYLTSSRPGGCGERDLWVSRRQDRKDDLGWEPPVNLGCEWNAYVNSLDAEVFPTFFEDEIGRLLMYYGSNRDNPGIALLDRYQSEMRADGTFGPATPSVELNSLSTEHSVTVRHDRLAVIFGISVARRDRVR